MSVINDKINSLSKSKFRSSFHLSRKMLEYVKTNGLDKIKRDAYYFIETRVSDISNVIDGRQTPMKNHPVFIAQHATATCCRSCLYKWHHIDKGRLLTSHEIDFCVCLIISWIEKEIKNR